MVGEHVVVLVSDLVGLGEMTNLGGRRIMDGSLAERQRNIHGLISATCRWALDFDIQLTTSLTLQPKPCTEPLTLLAHCLQP